MIPLLLGVALFALERRRPLRPLGRPLGKRLAVNAIHAGLALGTVLLLVAPAARAALGWATARPFGVTALLPDYPLLRFPAAFLLLDVSFYWWHRANHRIALLWRFHNVHHVDPDLDVSTALRFHFGELGLSSVFRVVQIGVIAPPLWVYLAYEATFQASTLFHHSNVRLPLRLERAVNGLLVTPRMHGIHHSRIKAETNSNYATVLPWWDRLHRTLVLNVPQARLRIGVPGYASARDNRAWSTLAMPFREQREYWPPGARHREGGSGEEDVTRLAE